ncbi:ABC transporter domain-containing protein C20G4.01 [Exophiala dermatitidis]
MATNADSKSEASRALRPDIKVRGLNYKFPDGSLGLQDINLELPAGSRTLLIGANGAGKTTLLRLLSGKRLAPAGTISIGGVDPFASGLEGVTYLGLEWVLNPIVRTDIAVPVLLDSVGGTFYPDRRDELVRILDIDLRWRMHAVSDGERRRVQLAMGLIRPWDVLLLDEITVDLDLLSRSNFLAWLRAETERRGATVVYATHILDNLVGWPTHLVHMHLGRVKQWGSMAEFEDQVGDVDAEAAGIGNSKLGQLVLKWLSDDLEERGPRNQSEKVRQSEGKTYENLEGLGGYGQEKKDESDR